MIPNLLTSPAIFRHPPLLEAALHGNAVAIQQLLTATVAPDLVLFGNALIKAAEFGHAHCLPLFLSHPLFPHTHARKISSEALTAAVIENHAECVQLLIPVTDSDGRYWGLQNAARNGHIQCVELLIDVGDPKWHNSQALQLACLGFYDDCVDALLPVSEPEYALNRLKNNEKPECWQYLEYKMCEQQQRILSAHTNGEPRVSSPRKM